MAQIWDEHVSIIFTVTLLFVCAIVMVILAVWFHRHRKLTVSTEHEQFEHILVTDLPEQGYVPLHVETIEDKLSKHYGADGTFTQKSQFIVASKSHNEPPCIMHVSERFVRHNKCYSSCIFDTVEKAQEMWILHCKKQNFEVLNIPGSYTCCPALQICGHNVDMLYPNAKIGSEQRKYRLKSDEDNETIGYMIAYDFIKGEFYVDPVGPKELTYYLNSHPVQCERVSIFKTEAEAKEVVEKFKENPVENVCVPDSSNFKQGIMYGINCCGSEQPYPDYFKELDTYFKTEHNIEGEAAGYVIVENKHQSMIGKHTIHAVDQDFIDEKRGLSHDANVTIFKDAFSALVQINHENTSAISFNPMKVEFDKKQANFFR